jgi:hypothetical protein
MLPLPFKNNGYMISKAPKKQKGAIHALQYSTQITPVNSQSCSIQKQDCFTVQFLY